MSEITDVEKADVMISGLRGHTRHYQWSHLWIGDLFICAVTGADQSSPDLRAWTIKQLAEQYDLAAREHTEGVDSSENDEAIMICTPWDGGVDRVMVYRDGLERAAREPAIRDGSYQPEDGKGGIFHTREEK